MRRVMLIFLASLCLCLYLVHGGQAGCARRYRIEAIRFAGSLKYDWPIPCLCWGRKKHTSEPELARYDNGQSKRYIDTLYFMMTLS